MRNLRVLLVAASLMSAAVPPVFAQAAPSPEALEAARGLVALMTPATISQMTDKMTGIVWPSIENAVRTRYPTIDTATLSELRRQYNQMVADTVAQAMTEAPAIYARYFTAGEMNQIAAFYRSPTGGKTLTVMPRVVADVGAAVLPHMQSLQNRIGPAFADTLKKHGLEPK